MSGSLKKTRIGDLLVEQGALTKEQLDRALAEQKSSGAMLGEMLVEQGVIAAQYLPVEAPSAEAVLLAPAYTFVMANRPVDVQFWLDLGSSSWGRRLYQPLTHPYVLSRRWPLGRRWTDADEDLANRQTLYHLAVGLIRRCRRVLYLTDSTYNERGFEDHGTLQQVIFRTLRRAARSDSTAENAEGRQ